MNENEELLDLIARVGITGYLQTGVLGVVHVCDKAGETSVVQYVPVRSTQIRRTWPPQLRERLSHDLLADNREHIFMVFQSDEDFHVQKMPRALAERQIMARASQHKKALTAAEASKAEEEPA